MIIFLIIIFLNKIILKIWFLFLLFHLHFLCLFVSLWQTHTTPSTKTQPHSSVTTKITQKKTHIPEPPPPSPKQPTTNPSEKQSHTHIGKTITYPHQHNRFNSTTAAQPSNHRINPMHQTLNLKPMAKLTSQISDPHHHNHTHFSNQIPNLWKRKK